ncbi:MAG: VTT domain-containing protein [Candidatus Woesearchaeota archaeon]
MKKYTKSFIVVFILLILVFLSFIFRENILTFIQNLNAVKEHILGFGDFAGIAMVFMIIAQILLAPIPGAPFVTAAGFIFGFWEGTLYAIIGTIIGGYIAFKIGEKFGKPFLIKIFKKENIERLENFPARKKLLFLFIIFAIPITPSDIIVFLAGASGIRLGPFLFVLILGRFPSILIATLIGAGVSHYNFTQVFVLILAVSILSVLIYLYRDKINKKIKEID